MINIFKKLFKAKEKKDEYIEIASFKHLQSFFNQVGRKRLIDSLPENDNKQKLTEVINQGYLALNERTKSKKAKNAINQRFLLGLTKIYLDHGKNIKLKQKK